MEALCIYNIICKMRPKGLIHAITSGHLLQHFTSRTIIVTLFVPAQTHETVHLLWCPVFVVTLPPVVSSFRCDTAGGGISVEWLIFYEDDPLWDGAGCGKYSTCCDFNSPPWFRKEISSPISDDIEMRLCADEDRADEDINFETLDIYVQ